MIAPILVMPLLDVLTDQQELPSKIVLLKSFALKNILSDVKMEPVKNQIPNVTKKLNVHQDKSDVQMDHVLSKIVVHL